MPLEDYRKIRKLGEGAHGVVHLYESVKREDDSAGAKRPRVERLVAVKKIRLRDRREGLSIEAIRELKLLQELRHKNVMPLLEVFSRKDSVYLVLENMESDLQAVLKDQSCVLMPGDVKQYFKMAMEGVRFIHARWILHRDL